jgi:hypothetical protein
MLNHPSHKYPFLFILLLSMGHSLVQEFITKDYQASVQAVLDRALDGVETA